jgi:ankyrin repeat protein
VNARGGTFGGSPVNLAAGYGQPHIVRALLAAGAELDVSEPERNPLFSAIHGGHLEIVKFLIERGIDYRVRYTGESMKDMDALAFARERGQTEIADYLETLNAT